MLHDDLWNLNRDLARSCLEHPFVRGLAEVRDAYQYALRCDYEFFSAPLEATP